MCTSLLVSSQISEIDLNACTHAELLGFSQAELIGTGKEGRKDGKRRAKLHAQWAEERDEAQMAGVVAAMKSGWRRSRRRGLDGEDVRFLFPLPLSFPRPSSPNPSPTRTAGPSRPVPPRPVGASIHLDPQDHLR